MSKISVPMIVGEDLNKDFVALFGLSPAEAQVLTTATATAKSQLAVLESNHAMIASAGPGKFTISIPFFPSEGGAVLDGFLQTIRSVLGDERYIYYNALSRFEPEMNSAFGMFGLSQSVINVDTTEGEAGLPAGATSMEFDHKNGAMTRTINANVDFLKMRLPLLYKKMIDSGAIPPGH